MKTLTKAAMGLGGKTRERNGGNAPVRQESGAGNNRVAKILAAQADPSTERRCKDVRQESGAGNNRVAKILAAQADPSTERRCKDVRLAMLGMAARAKLICSLGRPDLAATAAKLEAAAKIEPGSPADKDRLSRVKSLMEKGRNGDLEAARELNELRGEAIDLFVKASSQFATLFFQEENLGSNQMPYFNTTYKNPVKVTYMGQDGGTRAVMSVKAQKQTFFDMRQLVTDDVAYPIMDLNFGTDVNEAAKATVDIGWDMMNKVDLDAYTLLLTQFGKFNTGSGSLAQTYIPHARIITANLPVTNIIGGADWNTQALGHLGPAGGALLSDNTTTTVMRLDVLRAIMQYCASFANIFGEPLRPTGAILIPSSETLGVSNEIKPTGAFYNKIAEDIVQSYDQFNWMGINWTFIPDVTIPPGTCFPVLNRPVGRLFRKPQMDQEFLERNQRKNFETRAQSMVLQFATMEPWRPWVCQAIYHT